MWFDRFRPSVEQTKTVETNILPRATRFALDVPVSFVQDGPEQTGQSINVSESGLLATFDQPPELWTDGQLTLQAGEHYLSIKARVARVAGREAAFAFSVNNDNDRATINILVNSALRIPEKTSADSA